MLNLVHVVTRRSLVMAYVAIRLARTHVISCRASMTAAGFMCVCEPNGLNDLRWLMYSRQTGELQFHAQTYFWMHVSHKFFTLTVWHGMISALFFSHEPKKTISLASIL